MCHGVGGVSRMRVVGKVCINELVFVLWCLCDMGKMLVSEGSFVL